MVQHLRIPDLFKKSGISIGVSFISNPTVISQQSLVISHQSLVISQLSTSTDGATGIDILKSAVAKF
jgi:hypothetical protein